MLLNRQEMLERLNKDIVQVYFTKVNGEARKMNCTLSPDLLPQREIENHQELDANSTNEDRMIVWDTDKNAWRSFRLTSITGVISRTPGSDAVLG